VTHTQESDPTARPTHLADGPRSAPFGLTRSSIAIKQPPLDQLPLHVFPGSSPLAEKRSLTVCAVLRLADHGLNTVAEITLAKKLVHCECTAVVGVVVIQDDKAAGYDPIVEVCQASPYARIPVGVDAQDRDRTDPLPVRRQCLLEPALDAFRIGGESESLACALDLLQRSAAIIEVPGSSSRPKSRRWSAFLGRSAVILSARANERR
jgi:hypothetical protein